ncbi:MAG: molybdenum cofactor guanylyltransferase [Firmicutes bacterium]|nr:molybdenum cofactor guanylyltransferase [Bacillota bacterium]
MKRDETAAIILAGGRSSRFGTDKALQPFLGRPLLARVMETLRPLVGEVLIVARDEGRRAEFEALNLEARLVVDGSPLRGSIVGLAAGLRGTTREYNFFAACDMPFLNPGLIAHLLAVAGEDVAGEPGRRPVVVIPRWSSGLYEPLHSVYRQECLTAVENILAGGSLRIIDLFGAVPVRFVDETELRQFGPLEHAFMNINTRDDLARAERMASEAEPSG